MSCEGKLFINRFAFPSPSDNGDVFFHAIDYTVDEMAHKLTKVSFCSGFPGYTI